MSLQHEEIFTTLAAGFPGAYALSQDQTIRFWNSGAERILGYRSGQLTGRRCYRVANGGITAQCRNGCAVMGRFQEGGMPSVARLDLLSASGERKAMSVIPVVIGGSPEEPPLLVYLLGDDTENGTSIPGAESASGSSNEGDAGGAAPDGPVAVTDGIETRGLTPRELQVLQLVALGWKTGRIADELDLSPHTVLNHVRNFRRRLNAPSKLIAVATAIRLGIICVA